MNTLSGVASYSPNGPHGTNPAAADSERATANTSPAPHSRLTRRAPRAAATEALESGRAEVLGEDVVEGVPVYWIRIGPNTHDVAVSRETYEPVFIRVDQNGTFDSVRELRLPTAGGAVTGLSLAYGSAEGGPHVEISQAAEPVDSLRMIAGVRGYEPPEGTLLLSGTMALLRSNGLVVIIHAPDEATAIEVARSLRPYDATR